jgi:hypothetical protein
MPKLLLRRPFLPSDVSKNGRRRVNDPGKLRSALSALRFALRHDPSLPSPSDVFGDRFGDKEKSEKADARGPIDRPNAAALARRMPRQKYVPPTNHTRRSVRLLYLVSFVPLPFVHD